MYRDLIQLKEIHRIRNEDGISIRKISKQTGISRNTIRKILKYEFPPNFPVRKLSSSYSGKYIEIIKNILKANTQLDHEKQFTTKDIYNYLVQEEDYVGSYSTVYRIVRRLIDQEYNKKGQIIEMIYQFIITENKKSATDLLLNLYDRKSFIFAPLSVQNFLARTTVGRTFLKENQSNESTKQSQISWISNLLRYRIKYNEFISSSLTNEDFTILLDYLHDRRVTYRNKAAVILAYNKGISIHLISSTLKISRNTTRSVIRKFCQNGIEGLLSKRSTNKIPIDHDDIKNQIFSVLHEPPSNYGLNRTAWTFPLLCDVLKTKGLSISPRILSKFFKNEGYKWTKARTVLTSNDPDYRQKLDRIQHVLSNLSSTELFFSIDEFGPFSIKTQGGCKLIGPEEHNIVQQWQKSKGCLILTAALELSHNQVTHFYSLKKNTDEMIKLMYILIDQYKNYKKIYLSWDAASWHISKKLYTKIDENNISAEINGGPIVETVPLPARAQFLNVIESIFSGMARAIIHNSDYQSVDQAKSAIDLYFEKRNAHFKANPKRAGNKIWGMERTKAEFHPSNNCKDTKYR